MNRRGFLGALLAIPFAPRALDLVAKLRLVPATPSLASYTAILKELYSGQRVRDLVYKENLFTMMLGNPEKYREYMRPANVCRRNIERRRECPVESRYAAWREAA